MPAPSNQIKVTFTIILPFNFCAFVIFFLFHIDIEGKGWIIWEGGKGYVAPLKLLGGGGLTPWPPFSYAYVTDCFRSLRSAMFTSTKAKQKCFVHVENVKKLVSHASKS